MSFTLSEFNHGANASSTASHDMERPTEDVAYFDRGSIGDGALSPIPIKYKIVMVILIMVLLIPLSSMVHKKRKAYCLKSGESSWVWSHFKKQPANKQFAFCLLYQKDIFYSKYYSTGMLTHHLKNHHWAVYHNHLKSVADNALSMLQPDCSMQGSMSAFLMSCPKFENCLVNWMVATYQPVCCCEEPTFREMCLSLN
jgi:hypothetical protein